MLEPYVGASSFDNHGQRVVEGQRLMQAAGDIFLGWCPARGIDGLERDFYVRQLWDWKRSVDLETLSEPGAGGLRAALRRDPRPRPRALRRPRSRSAPTSARATTFDEAIADFAALYADQNEKDHKALLAAIASGEIAAEDA